MTSSIDLPPLKGGSFQLSLNQACAKYDMPQNFSLAGQTCIISGSNVGLGLTCARMLLEKGLSRLIMAVRSTEKGEAAAAALRAKHAGADIQVWALDMMSYGSIQEFAERCSTLPRIDFVILSAAMFKDRADFSPAGHEETIQVNYLSTALLSILLLPTLKTKSPPGKPARLTIVSSGIAFNAKFQEHDKVPILAALDEDKAFNSIERYATSKLLSHLFIVKLVQYVRREDVVVNLVDPGLTKGSGLHTHLSAPLRAAFWATKAVSGRPLEKGASTYIDAAVLKGHETHGSFLLDWAIHPFANMIYTPEGKRSIERLWEETMEELSFAGVQAILGSMQTGSRDEE